MATKRIVGMRLGKVHAQIIVDKIKRTGERTSKKGKTRGEFSCSGREPYKSYDTCRLGLKVVRNE